MYLNRQDLDKIHKVLEKFPEVEHFELIQETGSGIGNVTKMIFIQQVNGYVGRFEVEITGVEDW